ncbi:MAG: hypothetical protein WC736_10675 [Gallionella sp.]
MLTIDFELEESLRAIAEQEHSSPNEIIKKLIHQYIGQTQSSDLLVNIAKDLPEIACFKNQDPLTLQKAMRDEWN